MTIQETTNSDLVDILHRNAVQHNIRFSILVFGSWSYGNNTSWSDIDLFFIAHEEDLQALEGEAVLSSLGFKEDSQCFSREDIEELTEHIIDLCQIDKLLLGVRADIHLTTIEVIESGFLESEPREHFWNKFKQPFSEDYHYKLLTFNGNSVTYAAEYRNIMHFSYIKESPSLIVLENGDATVGHLLDKLLTSKIVYNCPTVEVESLADSLWVHFINNLLTYNGSLVELGTQTTNMDVLFTNSKSLLFKHKSFSHQFSDLLRTRYHNAVCNLNTEYNESK